MTDVIQKADETPLKPIKERLILAQAGACNCITKTPAIEYHDSLCRYRLLEEARLEIERLEDAQQAAWEDEQGYDI